MKAEASLWSRIFRPLASRRHPLSVSSPHPVSNLRLFKFRKNEDETEAEKRFRVIRTELQDWNQNYWEDHNRLFNEEKEKFMNREEDKRGTRALSHDELAAFYKRFLDENRAKHMQYSIEWYRRLFGLLGVATKAIFSRGGRRS